MSFLTSAMASPLSSPAASEHHSGDAFLAARLCLSSWDSYYKRRISAEIDSEREYLSMATRDSSIFSSWSTSKYTLYCSEPYVVTSTSTITVAATPECDGIPRARSITESILTYTTTANKNRPCPRQYKSGEEMYEGAQNRAWADAPKCRIPEAQCSESWKYFNKTFADWAYFGARHLRISEIDNIKAKIHKMRAKNLDDCVPILNRTRCIDERDADCSGFRDGPMCQYMEQISRWKDHLFVNCSNVLPHLRVIGLHKEQYNDLNKLPPNEMDRKLDQDSGCRVSVDQFVLLYFDLGIPETRDICTSSGYGEFFKYPYGHTTTVPPSGSAIVSTIFFYPHDLRHSANVIRKSHFYS